MLSHVFQLLPIMYHENVADIITLALNVLSSNYKTHKHSEIEDVALCVEEVEGSRVLLVRLGVIFFLLPLQRTGMFAIYTYIVSS